MGQGKWVYLNKGHRGVWYKTVMWNVRAGFDSYTLKSSYCIISIHIQQMTKLAFHIQILTKLSIHIQLSWWYVYKWIYLYWTVQSVPVQCLIGQWLLNIVHSELYLVGLYKFWNEPDLLNSKKTTYCANLFYRVWWRYWYIQQTKLLLSIHRNSIYCHKNGQHVKSGLSFY